MPEPAAATIVVLHGHDDEPALVDLPPPPGAAWTVVAPEGPVVTAGARRGWWRSDDDGAPVAADVAGAVAIVDAAVRDHAPAGPVVLGGFSQGGALALALALRPDGTGDEPDRPALAGAFAVGAWLPDLPGLAVDLPGAGERGVPLFVGHGTDDDAVDLLLGRGAARSLDRAGVPVAFEALDVGHRLDPFLPALAEWISRVLAGERPRSPP